MDKLFSEFPIVSKEKWEEKLTKELKGADFETSLRRNDEIEELNYSTYVHESDRTISKEIPGKYPFTRGDKNQNNDWGIGAVVIVENVQTANQKALDLLMTGCTTLIFDIKIDSLELDILFSQIGFEFISTQFKILNFEQYEQIVNYFSNKNECEILFRNDFLTNGIFDKNEFKKYGDLNKSHRFCHVNAFELQQCGASISQELSFALTSGHEYLVQLMNLGFSIDEAASSIHFSLGVGSNYFYEISKIRAFRKLWSKIVHEYKPANDESSICYITSEIGFLNKSLKDPYTNLLRQTTEGMSAVSAGVNTLLIHPYDCESINGTSILSSRMAMNISLVLKEESYFDKVIDPIGGSYSVEQLTEQIASKSWLNFQILEENGGITADKTKQLLTVGVTEKSRLRLDQIKSGEKMLIGVNKYPNPQIENNSWLEVESFFGIKKMILERDLQN